MGNAATIQDAEFVDIDQEGTPVGKPTSSTSVRSTTVQASLKSAPSVKAHNGEHDIVEGDDFADVKNPKYHFEDGFRQIASVLERLQRLSATESDTAALIRKPTLATALRFLRGFTSSSTYGEELSLVWVEKLHRHGVVTMTLQLWPAFWSNECDIAKEAVGYQALTAKQKKESPGAERTKTMITNFWQLCGILWNCSDSSVRVCRDVIDSDVLERLVALIARDDFNPQKLNSSSLHCYTVKASMGVLHNCLCHLHAEAKARLRNTDAVSVLRNYLESDVPMVSTKAAIILAYVINEHEIEFLNTKDDILEHLINELVKPALKSEKHRVLGFSLHEVLHALNALNANDENKRRSIELGAVALYRQAINETQNDKELTAAVAGLWVLSFFPTASEELVHCIPDLEKFKSHDLAEVRKAVSGVTWNVCGGRPVTAPAKGSRKEEEEGKVNNTKKKKKKRTTSESLGPLRRKSTSATASNISSPAFSKVGTASISSARIRKLSADARSTTTAPDTKGSNDEAPSAGHVMVSYDHQHQQVVLRLNQALQNANYVTWMDVDRMSGSTLEAMADAVEQASVVIVCMSDRYKNSPSCRTEAEYAYRLRKDVIPIRTEFKYQADGWLGLMMGTRLYFDCWNDDQVAECCSRLVKELGNRGKIGGGRKATFVPDIVNGPVLVSGQTQAQLNPVTKWTQDDVNRWINNLTPALPDSTRKALLDYDGPLLIELQAMCRSRRDFLFDKTTREELGLCRVRDALVLHKHLNKLCG